MCVVYVLLMYTISISILWVCQEGLVLLNLISRYMISKDIVNLCEIKFCISKLFIHCNTGCCPVPTTADVNTYSYVCVSVYWSLCVLLCVLFCAWYQIRGLVKITRVKVLRVNEFRSIISLSKIAHWMCCDDTFSQRNKATKRVDGLEG